MRLFCGGGGLQRVLSRDARYLACVDQDLALELVEVTSGSQIGSKKNFVEAQTVFFFVVLTLAEGENVNLQLARLKFSPDSHYLLAGSASNELAYDLRERREAK